MHPPWERSDQRRRPFVELQRDFVVVEGFRLQPLGGWDKEGSAWEWHPKGLIGAGWDTDPDAEQGGSPPDAFGRVAAGLEARLLGTGEWRADVDALFRHTSYADTPGRDLSGGDASILVQRTSRTSRAFVEGSWSRGDEPLAGLPDSVPRDLWNSAIGLGNEHRSWAWSSSLAWYRRDYLEDSRYWSADERDFDRLRLLGTWHLLGGTGSRLGIEAEGEALDRPAASSGNDARGFSAFGRWTHPLGERTRLDLRLGVSFIAYDDVSFRLPAYDDAQATVPNGSVSLDWVGTGTTWARLVASIGPEESLDLQVNTSIMQQLLLEHRWELADRVRLVTIAWATRREDRAGAPGTEPRTARGTHLRLGLEYEMRDGVGVRLWGNMERDNYTLADAQERYVASLEWVIAL